MEEQIGLLKVESNFVTSSYNYRHLPTYRLGSPGQRGRRVHTSSPAHRTYSINRELVTHDPL